MDLNVGKRIKIVAKVEIAPRYRLFRSGRSKITCQTGNNNALSLKSFDVHV